MFDVKDIIDEDLNDDVADDIIMLKVITMII
jgi:hypothetical protein